MEKEKIKALEVFELASEYFGPDYVDTNIPQVTKDPKRDYNSNPVSCYIMIWFPKVTVSNEKNKSVDIYDLFVKLDLYTSGHLMEEGLKMMRTTYTKTQWLAGYSHSHLPRIGNQPVWQEPCFGSGPIRNTINMLRAQYDYDRWGLLMFEIEKFVRTESLRGGPYIRLESIGAGTVRYNPLAPSDNCLPTDFDKQMALEVIRSGELNFGFAGISWCIGDEPLELTLKITRIVVKAVKEGRCEGWTLQDMVEQGCLIPVVLKDGTLNSLATARSLSPSSSVLVSFKGRHFSLTVREDGATFHYFYVLESTFVCNILKIITGLINTLYGKERKVGTKGKLFIV